MEGCVSPILLRYPNLRLRRQRLYATPFAGPGCSGDTFTIELSTNVRKDVNMGKRRKKPDAGL
jgi:hypothetical protein